MAELNIGDHCYVSDCKQLDFLPLRCHLCNMIFCKEHASYDAHSCNAYCHSSTLSPSSLDNLAQVWYKCDLAACTGRELMEIRCSLCRANYCLAHRHPSDHACPSSVPCTDPLPKTSAHIKGILESRPIADKTAKKILTNPKSVATAAKIALIKMKQKAKGDVSIPEADRVFFNVALPSNCGQKCQPMYFNRGWYVGKAVDKVASLTGLANFNKQGSSVLSLRMFNSTTGLLCPSNSTLAELTDQGTMLQNGSSVIVEYADDSVQHISVEPYLL